MADGEAWLLPSGLSSSAGLQELQKLGMTAASGKAPFLNAPGKAARSHDHLGRDRHANAGVPSPSVSCIPMAALFPHIRYKFGQTGVRVKQSVAETAVRATSNKIVSWSSAC